MVENALAFALGTWLLQQRSALPSALFSLVLPAAALGLVFLARYRRAERDWLKRAVAAGLCLIAGFAWALWIAHVRLADALPLEWEGRDIRLIGVVADLPQPGRHGLRFALDVQRVLTPLAHAPRRVSLTWYASEEASPPPLAPGQRWRLTVRLRRPHGAANPHGFDYEAWLLERGIRATGYIRSDPANQLLAGSTVAPEYWVERLRGRARERIESALAGDPNAGVLVALAVGEQRAIDTQQWTVFTRTGVNHLMSISGLHITMLAGLAFAITYWLWRCSVWLTARFAAQKAAAVAGLLCAAGYALVSGFGVPAQRTTFMLAVFAAALLLGREGRVPSMLALALLVVVIVDPWATLSAGFWLSFGAVALIAYVTAGRMAQPPWLANWLRVQGALTVGLVPLLIGLFQQVSLISPVANALAVPIVSLGVVPLTLLGVVMPADLVLEFAASLMGFTTTLLELMSRAPHAVWSQHAPPTWAVPFGLLGIVWCLAPRGFPARWAGALLLLPLCLVRADGPKAGQAWVDLLDVGQGLAVLVRTSQHALLYDAGPAFASDADSGNRIVVPYLRASGVRALDGVVVSHDDTDHRGGLVSVLRAVPVDWVASSLPRDDPAVLLAPHRHRCAAGEHWEWDGVTFAFLHPPADSYNQPAWSDNDRSCVLRVASASGSVLIAGDIARGAEGLLAREAAAQLAADVLVVPHHGSATSSTDAFISRVQPRAALIAVGYHNRFGHPAPAVLDRYAARGTAIWRTDRDGALLVRFGPPLSVSAWRTERPRYWSGR